MDGESLCVSTLDRFNFAYYWRKGRRTQQDETAFYAQRTLCGGGFFSPTDKHIHMSLLSIRRSTHVILKTLQPFLFLELHIRTICPRQTEGADSF